MTTLREAAQQALEALETAPLDHNSVKSRFFERRHHAITALRAALAEPVQKPPCATKECMPSECPNCASLEAQNTELDRKLAELEEGNADELTVAYMMGAHSKLRTLTDEVIADLWYQNGTHHHHFARAIERWLKGEK
jgi:hypothetical protein